MSGRGKRVPAVAGASAVAVETAPAGVRIGPLAGLLLGLIRIAIGFVQGVNLTIGLWAVPNEWYWTYVLLALINLTLALTAAGRYLGVDALLHPRAEAAAARGNGLARLVAALT